MGGVCVDFCAPYYHWGPREPYVLKSEDHDELAQGFSGHGRSGPAPLLADAVGQLVSMTLALGGLALPLTTDQES